MAADFELRNLIIWSKSRFAIGRGDYHWQHEPCWYCVREGRPSHWQGSRKESTVWTIGSRLGFGAGQGEDARTGHGAQKPVECMRRPLVNSSKPGDLVYDPFLGSGTTVIAAQDAGRHCLGLELTPAYCDLIVRRWQDFAHGHATLEGDGRTFAEIQRERLAPPAAVHDEAATTANAARKPRRGGRKHEAAPTTGADIAAPV